MSLDKNIPAERRGNKEYATKIMNEVDGLLLTIKNDRVKMRTYMNALKIRSERILRWSR